MSKRNVILHGLLVCIVLAVSVQQVDGMATCGMRSISAANDSVTTEGRVSDTIATDSLATEGMATDSLVSDSMTTDTIATGSMATRENPSDTVSVWSISPTTQPLFALPDMRIEVNISRRELYVLSGREKVATYPVAVGKPDWPTRTGSWGIYEVVWNPWWHPPEEEWAWYHAIMAPGDPDNPLGRAQLIYDAPRSIHGTIEPSSIGKAASHGSIRVTNDVAKKLARQVMESTGIVYDEEWYEAVHGDRSRNVRIHLSERIPIRVYNER